jgi:hypothetical protein
MEKLIIENRTDRPLSSLMGHVRTILEQGRISNNDTQYCYLTTFKDGIVIASEKNKCSDRLVLEILPRLVKTTNTEELAP